MKSEFHKLLEERSKLQLRIDEANRDLQIVGLDVELWIKKAHANEARVYKILEELEKGCSNLKLYFRLCVKAKKMTRDIVELLRGGRFDRIANTPPLSSREHIIPIATENFLVQNQGDEIIEVAYAPQM
ncbi:hypothetical protein LguiB_012842 [Lonicera macranthoides]